MGRGGVGQSGSGKYENRRVVVKKRVNQLIQKYDKSEYIATGGFVLQYGVLIKENITLSDF